MGDCMLQRAETHKSGVDIGDVIRGDNSEKYN